MKVKEKKLLKVLLDEAEFEKNTLLLEGYFSSLLFNNNLEKKNIFTDSFIFNVFKADKVIRFIIDIRDLKQIEIEKEETVKVKVIKIKTENLNFDEVMLSFFKELKPQNYKIYNKKDTEQFLFNLCQI